MSPTSNIIAGLLAGLATLAAATPVSAQSGPTMRIRYHVAELRTDAGAQALYQRIKRGAHRSCANGGWSVYPQTVRRCSNELVELAVKQLADPRVAGIYAASRGPVRIASAK